MVCGPFKTRDEPEYIIEKVVYIEREPKKSNQQRKKARAIYAASLDPIHLGHVDIITRAARTFDGLEVAVGINVEKKYTFTLEERVEMTRQALSRLPNVQVTSFKGLLVRYASERGIGTIVKGVRNAEDFRVESLFHVAGDSQHLGIETALLIARPELSHVSSSVVKVLQADHGDIHEYVPLVIKQRLEERMSGQYIVGITGETGSGKSYVGERFVALGKERGIEVHNIELDNIGHQILGGSAKYEEIREAVIKEFGKGVKKFNGNISRKALGELVFSDRRRLQRLNELIHKPILSELQQTLYGKRGLVLINGALIAETGTSYLSNNNVVLVKTDYDERVARLRSKGLGQRQIDSISQAQYSFEEKQRILQEERDKYNYGTIWVVNNTQEQSAKAISDVFYKIVNTLGVK